MRIITAIIFSLFSTIVTANTELCSIQKALHSTTCIQFSVGQGTGCAWMCNYCESQLGTSNYYFTDGVCTYEYGGCVGSPQTGVTYTCCAN
jgi:hypothetical protein